MEQLQVRTRPRVPAIQCGAGTAGRRIDRHLSVLGAPALSTVDTAEAVGLIRELTPRGVNTQAASRRGTTRVRLLAPLRRLKRSLLGSRG